MEIQNDPPTADESSRAADTTELFPTCPAAAQPMAAFMVGVSGLKDEPEGFEAWES